MTKIVNFLELLKFFLLPGHGKRTWERTPRETIKFFSEQPQNREMNSFLQDLIALHTPSKSLLEVGCYTGQRLRAISEKFPGVRLRGLEINPFACELGNLEFKRLGFGERIISCGDLKDMDYSREKYSAVLSWAVLMYVHPLDIRQTLRNLVSMTDEVLILIEPTSSRIRHKFLPLRNRSFLHDYRSMLLTYSKDVGEVLEIGVPAHIWAPSFGHAAVIILKKQLSD